MSYMQIIYHLISSNRALLYGIHVFCSESVIAYLFLEGDYPCFSFASLGCSPREADWHRQDSICIILFSHMWAPYFEASITPESYPQGCLESGDFK